MEMPAPKRASKSWLSISSSEIFLVFAHSRTVPRNSRIFSIVIVSSRIFSSSVSAHSPNGPPDSYGLAAVPHATTSLILFRLRGFAFVDVSNGVHRRCQKSRMSRWRHANNAQATVDVDNLPGDPRTHRTEQEACRICDLVEGRAPALWGIRFRVSADFLEVLDTARCRRIFGARRYRIHADTTFPKLDRERNDGRIQRSFR